MTEDEAKTKWCPFARVSWNNKSSINRVSGGDVVGLPITSMCVASACMAWRWRDFPKRDHGYCGMAERT